MSYAITVWGAAPNSHISRMNKLHKKGIRHVCSSKYNAHTEPLFKKEKILKLNDLYKLQCVKLMFKKVNKKLHSYHTSKLLTNYETTGKHTRTENDVHINVTDNNLSKTNSINLKAGNNWNELPSEIKDNAHKVTISTFTKHVKNSYISKYSNTCTKDQCYVCENQ